MKERGSDKKFSVECLEHFGLAPLTRKVVRMNRDLAFFLMILLVLALCSGCVVGRWVQEGKTDEEIQQDLKDCQATIVEEQGGEALPQQYTSTRYWEREPPLKPSQEAVMARAIRLCMEDKGYQYSRK